MKLKLAILFLGAFLIFGCSKKKEAPDLKYTLEEFNLILDSTGAAGDKDAANAIKFEDYAPGVNRVNSRPMVYQRLSFAVVEFETEKQAREEALRLNQYYSRNWLFDKVEGEPILEDLMIVKFHAANPKRRVQRKPVNIPSEHAAPAGGGEHH
nr:hypothetical protein BHI3_15630 [Bacteriovorax sp. HI3]